MAALRAELERNPKLLNGWTFGVEKEGLRVLEDGRLSQEPHPQLLGSKLCHPNITTDYAENLLELITPPVQTLSDTMQWLHDLHAFTHKNIGRELIWPSSMPCTLPNDDDIPIAYYGTSNSGRMKSVYRQGLALRYGKAMQMIAGAHYNVSFPSRLLDLAVNRLNLSDNSIAYFHVIRNFIRRQSLLLLLFGASPAFDQGLVPDDRLTPDIERHLDDTLFLPYATSFRMSNLGYNNDAQTQLKLTYNTLEEYVNTLHRAVSCPHQPYEKLGLLDQYGDYQQLTTALLQVENEHYAAIRPKQTTRRGERPINALIKRGVQYLEVRSLDLDPFTPVGIREDTMTFINTMILHCLLEPSPKMTDVEKLHWQENQQAVAKMGRYSELTIYHPTQNQHVHFHSWVETQLTELQHTAKLLDAAEGTDQHTSAIQGALSTLHNLDHLPSSQVLLSLTNQQSHQSFGLEQAKDHHEHYLRVCTQPNKLNELIQLRTESWKNQRQLESSDTLTFSDYLNGYLTPPADCMTTSPVENN